MQSISVAVVRTYMKLAMDHVIRGVRMAAHCI